MIFRSLLFLLIESGQRIIDSLMLGNCFNQSTENANSSQRFRTTKISCQARKGGFTIARLKRAAC